MQRLFEMAVLALLLLLAATAADSQYVCYRSASCGDGDPRPVFVLGRTAEDCCGQPNVMSARPREIEAAENCSSCGPPSLERLTPRYTAVTPSDTLVLEVQATGYRAITWVVQNGIVMHDFPRVELEDFSKRFILNNASVDDFGRYEVDLHTINGSVLTVEFFVDKYTTPLVSVNEAGEGTNVTLTCTAVGNPLPSVTWQHDNVTFPPSTTLTSSTPPPSTTVVLELHEERTGEEYTCVAINSHAGETSIVSESIIVRPNPPRLTAVSPMGIEVNRTAPATVELSCTAEGLPLPTIHWTRNDVLLEGGVEVTMDTRTDDVVSQLRIVSSGYEDRGNYSCIAVNVAGEDAFTFQVFVMVPPNVTVWPAQEEVNIHDMGRRVTFVCQAFGVPTPQVTWVSDTGRPLNGYCEGPSQDTEKDDESSGLMDMGGEAPEDIVGRDDESSGFMDIGGEAPEDIVTPAPHETTPPSSLTEELRPNDCNVSLMQMESTTVSVLTIRGAHMERSANFTCYARNDVGNGNGSVELLVTAAPFFLSRPDPILHPIISRYLELNCTAVGQSSLEVTWTKDGFPLDLSPSQEGRVRVELSTVGAGIANVVRIVSVEERDAGVYVCLAKDENGTSSSSTTVNVRVPARITSPPVTTQADLYSNSSFTCQAQGQPLPSISWSKISGTDTILLDDFSTGTPTSNMSVVRVMQVGTDVAAGIVTSQLVIENVQREDQGTYVCSTSNGVTLSNLTNVRSNATAELVVEAPPSFISVPRNTTTVLSPNPVVFSCIARGLPQPVVRWFFAGMQLANLITSRVAISTSTILGSDRVTNSSLRLERTELGDGGHYTCVAESSAGNVSFTFQLTVQVTSSVMVTQASSSDHTPEGETLSLICEARSFPTPVVTWLHNGNPVFPFGDSSRPRHTVVSVEVEEYLLRSVLNISDVVPEDAGEYRCRLDNLNEPVDYSIMVSIEANNDCFLGNDSTPCLNGGMCVDEVGGYTCNCTDGFMGQNCSRPVRNSTVPVIITDPDNQEVSIFRPANFTCLATGEPPPTYSWFKDGELVAETLEPVYVIPEARPSHRGRYACIAKNSNGITNSSSPGLLTIMGVLQYLATFTNCRNNASENFTELVTKMENRISGNTLETTPTVIYSITPRPVRSGRPPEDQVVVTVVTNSSGSSRVSKDLERELQIITREFGCQFTGVVRFDGCQHETRSLSVEYSVLVPWRETEIKKVVTIDCPCGNLNATIHGGRTLMRKCGGSYTYGAEWGDVTDNCAFSNITFQLCDITTLGDISQQAGALAEATEGSSSFSSLDFTIATTIITSLADSALATNQLEFQKNFTRSFNNLLDTETETLIESQEQSQAPSRLLETLSIFGGQVMVGSEAVLFSEQRFQLQVEERAMFTNHTFSPDLSAQEKEFQKDTEETPLMDASITLPMDLVKQLRREKLRVINSALLTDSLFVVERDSMLGKRLANGTMVVGNVIISASVAAVERVVGLEEPVVIRFTQTKGLNETNMTEARCVFWEPPNTTETFGTWSSEGCELVRVEEGEIVCECDHLTHFGLLLAINPLPPEMGLPLEIITYFALTLSIVCLLITIITYLATKKLRAQVFGQMLLHMCVSLFGLYASFLVAQQGAHYTSIPGFCFATSAVLQYFMLVYFFWTAVEAVHLYLKLVRVFGADVRHYVLRASIIAWGVPLVIVAVCAGTGIYFDVVDGIALFAARDASNNIFFCRPASWPFYFGIVLPFGLLYIFNWTVFTIIMYSMCRRLCRKQKLPGEKHTKEYKQLTLIAVCLSVMFGLGWVFGLFVAIPNPELSTVAQYLFAIFIGIHGVFIFFFHCLRSSEVRKEWRRRFFAVCCCAKKPDHFATTTPHNVPKLKGVGYLGSVGPSDSEQRHNPLYESKENLFSDTTTATSYVSPYDMSSPRKEKVKDDSDSLTKVQSLGSIDGLSYASQTVEIDFKTAENSDEEDGEPTAKDLTAIVNTSFEFPTGDGYAASNFMMPPLPTSPPHVTSPSSPEAPLPMHTSASPDSPHPVHTVVETECDMLDTTVM